MKVRYVAAGASRGDRIECIVIGAGVVGLAIGRALAMQSREVLVLEVERAIGTGASSPTPRSSMPGSTTRRVHSRLGFASREADAVPILRDEAGIAPSARQAHCGDLGIRGAGARALPVPRQRQRRRGSCYAHCGTSARARTSGLLRRWPYFAVDRNRGFARSDASLSGGYRGMWGAVPLCSVHP